MSKDQKKLALIAILAYLFWPKSVKAAGIPAGNTTVGFKTPSGVPLNLQPADGAQSVDANGNCYQFSASDNSWYPCQVYGPPPSGGLPGTSGQIATDGQIYTDPNGNCFQYLAAYGSWYPCGVS